MALAEANPRGGGSPLVGSHNVYAKREVDLVSRYDGFFYAHRERINSKPQLCRLRPIVVRIDKRVDHSANQAFYAKTSFGEGMPFCSYEEDVKSRHKNELQACLLYLRDFMEAIDSEDVLTIQAFRQHRNKLAHELPASLNIRPQDHLPLLEKVDKALFKLSNHNAYMEVGADPELRAKGSDWDSAYGQEYGLFREILEKVRAMDIQVSRYA